MRYFPLWYSTAFLGLEFLTRNVLMRVSPQDLATPEAFSRTPSRVWEFYHYRRELALSRKPNAAHLAIAECEARLRKQGRSVVVITQCIDDLHQQAGSKHVLKVHGESWDFFAPILCVRLRAEKSMQTTFAEREIFSVRPLGLNVKQLCF